MFRNIKTLTFFPPCIRRKSSLREKLARLINEYWKSFHHRDRDDTLFTSGATRKNSKSTAKIGPKINLTTSQTRRFRAKRGKQLQTDSLGYRHGRATSRWGGGGRSRSQLILARNSPLSRRWIKSSEMGHKLVELMAKKVQLKTFVS